MSFSALDHLPWAILCIVGLGLLYRFLEKRQSAMALMYSHLPFLESFSTANVRLERLLRACFILGVSLVGLAWCGPHISLRLPMNDGSVVVCIDTSGSMASTDIVPTRSAAAINALHQFVRELGPSVRVGIVSFATDAQVILQPTRNRENISDVIDTLPRPNGATAIGDALGLAGQILPHEGKRAIVLMTDGVNNRGSDPLEVVHDLAAHHVPVYAIGIGTKDSGRIVPGTNEEASTDNEALKQYAEITGGTAVMTADADAIVRAFATLARSTIWETQRIDTSLICASLGGGLVTLVFLLGFGIGKYP